jgi:hypothetical protein
MSIGAEKLRKLKLKTPLQLLLLAVFVLLVAIAYHHRVRLAPWLNDAPNFAGLFLAMVGVAFLFMKEPMDMLNDHPIARYVIAFFFMGAGVLGLAVDHYSRVQAEIDRQVLQGQIGTLVDSSKFQATHDDVNKVDHDMLKGFDSVVTSVGGKAGDPAPNKSPSKRHREASSPKYSSIYPVRPETCALHRSSAAIWLAGD